MLDKNIIFSADGYKATHWLAYHPNLQNIFSYFEARKGAKFPETIFFGLQYILKQYLTGQIVTQEKIDKAENYFKVYFGTDKYFNRNGWQYILEKHEGRLPIVVKSVPEGTKVTISNVLMTVESTDERCGWLVNYLETVLSHVWFPTTVASLSYYSKKMIKSYLGKTAENDNGLDFMLHDFAFRGVSSYESSEIGGLAHLINFRGTDTLSVVDFAEDYYNADLSTLCHSVWASEHSVMTAEGVDAEVSIVERILDKVPTGTVSVVGDSFDIYRFVSEIVGTRFRFQIMARDGVFVIRPDSISPEHPTPEAQVLWIAKELANKFGGTRNSKGYLVLNPKVRILWGDGIDYDGIEAILKTLEENGFSAENMVFGMGGGLLQKVNRDTMRFAFKASAEKYDDVWHDVFKSPKDASKASKKGRLKLIKDVDGNFSTVAETAPGEDLLQTVFLNGELVKEYSFDEIRERAKI